MKFETIPEVLNAINQVTTKYEQYFSESEIDYIDSYCGFVMRQFNKGTFNDSNTKMEWCKYNIRYGRNSVIGFLGEIIAVGVLNQKSNVNGTEYRLLTEDQATQTSGVDIQVRNKKWRYPYTAQVKVANLQSMKLNLNKTDANRLIVVDISNFPNDVVMMCDMQEYKKIVNESTDTRLTYDNLKIQAVGNRKLRVSTHVV